MKIIHCINSYDVNEYFRQNYYVQELGKNKKNRVYVLTSNKKLYPPINNRNLPAGIQMDDRVIIIRIKPIFIIKDMVYFPYKKFIDRISPDIVHVYEARQYISYKVAEYCIGKNIPVVYEHEQKSLGFSPLGKIRSILFINQWLKNIIDKIDLIRVVTPGAKKYITRYIGNNYERKINLTTLAYDKNSFYINQNLRNNFRRKYNIPDQSLIIGTSGKLFNEKKIEIVIDAFKSASKMKNNIFLIISGTGEKKCINEISEKIENVKNIIFEPVFFNRHELNGFFNGIDYAIWTKPTISFFEALGTGLKIIIPYGGGTSHLKNDNIVFYGLNGGIEQEETVINDSKLIEKELRDIFMKLIPYKRTVVSEYEKTYIVDQLFSQYKNLLKKPVA